MFASLAFIFLFGMLGAVSPAVVVPRMVRLMEEKRGTAQGVPQMIMAGAACGWALSRFFARCSLNDTLRTVTMLAVACLLIAAEGWLEGRVAFSGLLAVMGMAVMLRRESPKPCAAALSGKVGQLWQAAEILLFVLVGAAVDIRYTMEAGVGAVVMIGLALVIRSLGTALCVAGTKLTQQERLFCVLAYLPKATVQAAIGATPLAMGLACGKIVLSVAVLAILITAPLGAIAMDATYKHLLRPEEE